MNLETTTGTTWRGMTLTLTQSGSPVDITGALIEMEVKRNHCSDSVLEFSTNDGTIVINNPTLGKFYFPSRYIDITPTTYNFACKMTLNGNVDQIFSGTWTINK